MLISANNQTFSVWFNHISRNNVFLFSIWPRPKDDFEGYSFLPCYIKQRSIEIDKLARSTTTHINLLSCFFQGGKGKRWYSKVYSFIRWVFESKMLTKRSRCLHHHLGYGKLHIIVIMNSQPTARQALYSSAKRGEKMKQQRILQLLARRRFIKFFSIQDHCLRLHKRFIKDVTKKEV